MKKHKKRLSIPSSKMIAKSTKYAMSIALLLYLILGNRAIKLGNVAKKQELNILSTQIEALHISNRNSSEEIDELYMTETNDRFCSLNFVECEDEQDPYSKPEYRALLQATWRLETGNGTSELWTRFKNPGGIKCGYEYCKYPDTETAWSTLDALLKQYVEKYGYDLESIRNEYCGSHCSSKDLKEFTLIYNEELGKEH